MLMTTIMTKWLLLFDDNDYHDVVVVVGVLKGGGEGVESERYADDNNYDEVVVVI